MGTRLNLPLTGVAFNSVTSSEPGAIYVAKLGDLFELALGFSIGDGERRATGLLPLTGGHLLEAHFFVADSGFASEIEPISVYRAAEGSDSAKLVLEQTDDPGGGNLSPRVGMIGSIGNVPSLAVCVRDGDRSRGLSPLILDLGSMRCRATDYGFNEVFTLVKVTHPLLAE